MLLLNVPMAESNAVGTERAIFSGQWFGDGAVVVGMLNQPISHHFVPVFYLQAWAAADGRVTRYYRPHKEVVVSPIGPKYTGYEDHLYTLQGLPPDQQAFLETNFFSPVDSAAAVAHQLLLAGKLNSLTNQQRVDWARFMMSMQLRSPFSLGELQRLADHVMRSKLSVDDPEFTVAMKSGTSQTMYEWTQQNHPLVIAEAHKRFLPGLIDHESLGQYLINMFWGTLDVSSASHSLLTSDRPLISTHGWKDPKAVLIFPLSPSALWVATNSPERMNNVANTSRIRHVKMVNEAIVHNAVDFVFGATASHLDFVKRRLRRPDQEPVPGPVGRGRPDCPP